MTAEAIVQFDQASHSWQDAAMLTIKGATAAEFLQGYLTCDTVQLKDDTALPMSICNVKGRVIASGWALGSASQVHLIVHSSLADTTITFLKPYITFSPCEFANPATQPVFVGAQGDVALADNIYIQYTPVPADDYADCSTMMNSWLIQRQFAFVSASVSAQFLPQMLALEEHGAVDFKKGCYLGQEIVARAQFRGAVKRRLTRAQWTDTQPQVGQTLADGSIVIASDAQQGLVVAKA